MRQRSEVVFWVLRDESSVPQPRGQVIKLGFCHPRKKQTKNFKATYPANGFVKSAEVKRQTFLRKIADFIPFFYERSAVRIGYRQLSLDPRTYPDLQDKKKKRKKERKKGLLRG